MRYKKKIRDIYGRLHKHFGDPGWWPARTKFEIAVGAILTQNTSWKNVEKAIERLRENKAMDPYRIRDIDIPVLRGYIYSSGFHGIKAKRLKEFVEFFIDRFDADFSRMKSMPLRVLREELLSVNGIGPETADSIILYAVGKPVFVVDAYARRIFSRHEIIDFNASYDKIQGLVEGAFSKRTVTFNRFHAFIVETAKAFCRKRDPLCGECPLCGDK